MKAPLVVVAWALFATPAFAQQPRVVNTRLVARTAAPDLATAISTIAGQQVEPAWIGYAVPIFNRDGSGRQDGWSARCRLEQTTVDTAGNATSVGAIRLEPSSTLMVLMRAQDRAVERIRTLSDDCAIDTGGLALYWIDGANPAQSVTFLKNFAASASLRGQSDSALSAISLHQDRSAAAALLDLAKNSPDARVRQRALVSVAQRAESQAIPAISEAIDRDPDTEVKKQAVSALSRLPQNEGVPLLINLVKTNKNPAVRKQAIFWLGQSKDPRAITFFEEILR